MQSWLITCSNLLPTFKELKKEELLSDTEVRLHGTNFIKIDIQKISHKTKFRIKVNDDVNLEEFNFLKEASVNNNKDTKDFTYF